MQQLLLAVCLFFGIATGFNTGREHHWRRSHQAREPRNIALLIGIADYKNLTDQPSADGITDLVAPRNDLPRMKQALERWGFRGSENVHVISESQASRAGVMAALRWVAENATDPRDAVVIYYTGHGSTAPDVDGDEARRNPSDKTDEALVPWDARQIHDPAQLILDDDINKFLASLKTTNVTLIVDACFSGTITRGAGVRARGPLAPLGAADGGSGKGAGMDSTDRPGNYVLLTAASAQELAIEAAFGSDSTTEFGLFSYYLTESMNRADQTARYEDLWKDVKRSLENSSKWRGQTPQLEGVHGARLFQVNGDVARLPYVTVSSAGARIHIDAGAVHGLREGAEYEVFPAEEKIFRGAPLGRITVDSLGTLESFASVESGGPFPRDARAVLSRAPIGALSLEYLNVYVDSTANVLKETIRGFPWIRISNSRSAPLEVARADGVTRFLYRGDEIIPADSAHVVQKTITGPKGRMVVTGYADGADLCEPLSRGFAAEAFNQIHNPSAPPSLGVNVRLVRKGTDPIPQRDLSIADTAFIKDTVVLVAWVDAPPNSVVYLTVAEEGLSSKPAMLYPLRGQMNHPIKLNQWEPLRSFKPNEPPGVDVIKAVATSRQYDFQTLMSSLPTCPDSASRGRLEEDADAVNGWTAVERRVVFLRKGKR